MRADTAVIIVLVAITTDAGILRSSPFFAAATSAFITAPMSTGLQYNIRYANNPVSYIAASAPLMKAIAPSPIVLKALPPPIVATMKATPVSVASAPVVKSISASQIVAAPVIQSLSPVSVGPAPITYTYSGYTPLYGSYILKR